ncbi:MAG: helix-turn-helix transcriptional regulator [Actinomycetota bacterium]|nr:helix-turn-helix transcriptional regulator [Actinomycetota bacterium]
MPTSYGTVLRDWRAARRMSQLELATVADVSQRHVSFLEKGRSKPSREMVIHLAIALDVPLRERNTMLMVAGYSSEYGETALTAPALDQVRGILERILRAHEPFPAFVVDRGWDVVLANQAAMRFTTSMIDPSNPIAVAGMNALKLVLHPDGVRRFIVNWPQVATAALRRLDNEVASRPTDAVLRDLRDEVLSYPDVAGLLRHPALPAAEDLLVPFHYRVGNNDLKLFSTIAILGEAHDITLEELRLETFFAADAATEELLRDGIL